VKKKEEQSERTDVSWEWEVKIPGCYLFMTLSVCRRKAVIRKVDPPPSSK
jgi:hypothetical protein